MSHSLSAVPIADIAQLERELHGIAEPEHTDNCRPSKMGHRPCNPRVYHSDPTSKNKEKAQRSHTCGFNSHLSLLVR
eukprot:scaffold177195_cov32-Tisochrysis_lutea.AAC.3